MSMAQAQVRPLSGGSRDCRAGLSLYTPLYAPRATASVLPMQWTGLRQMAGSIEFK